MPCGCQGNRWNPDSDLVPAEVGPSASGYFWNGVDSNGDLIPEPEPEAPKWSPESGTADE